MVTITRNEVSELQYASAIGVTGDSIYTIGTSNTSNYKIRITDLMISGAGTKRTVKIYPLNYTTSKPITLDIPANGIVSHGFELPYNFNVVASTQVVRNIVASASGTGCYCVLKGYQES